MAWLFGMTIECGLDRDAGQRVVHHFAGFTVASKAGSPSRFTVELDHDPWGEGRGEYWVSVVSDEFRSGESPASDERLAELRDGLYRRLRTAPPYRFALVGVEVFATVTYEALLELLDDPSSLSPAYDGLVLRADDVAATSAASLFTPFSDGYRWIRPLAGYR
jgi:hypothetical protein